MGEIEQAQENKMQLRENGFKKEETPQWQNADGRGNHADREEIILVKVLRKREWVGSNT